MFDCNINNQNGSKDAEFFQRTAFVTKVSICVAPTLQITCII